jgi:crotonobetainyl-CoA:carnitine CoA-transferase CaiB-like acyl-CoA transferase
MEQAGPPSGPLSGLPVADFSRVLAGPAGGAVPTAAHPLDFSRTPPRYDLPPPRLDEHGTQIRAWLASRPAESR